MSTELATVQHGSTLALSNEQPFWNDHQIAALRQMGVEGAGNGDLAVFHHVCQRTGLDPFARQIHMVSRNARENNQWVKKWTIQTGIDGYRLIADRADKRDRTMREYEDTLWCGDDGAWRDVWTSIRPPAAAKVTLLRNGRRFPAIATYREYVQTKRDGEPNSMWSNMPANQLAKCAEALALRKAYPQDLSGIYTDDEMGQAERQEPRVVRNENDTPAADRMAAILNPSPAPDAATSVPAAPPAPSVADEGDVHSEASAGEDSPHLNPRSGLAKRMFAALGAAGITDRDERLAEVSAIIGRTVTSSSQMTDADAEAVIATLEVRPHDAEPIDVTDAELVPDEADQ